MKMGTDTTKLVYITEKDLESSETKIERIMQ